mgnify:CR=1 FL=1
MEQASDKVSETNSSAAGAKKQEPVMSSLQDGAFVVEKDFKSDRTHQDKVTGIVYLNKREFFTSSLDCSLKIWDKVLQGISYTYEMSISETPKPLNAMGITGENGDLLIIGLGSEQFVVYGVELKN